MLGAAGMSRTIKTARDVAIALIIISAVMWRMDYEETLDGTLIGKIPSTEVICYCCE